LGAVRGEKLPTSGVTPLGDTAGGGTVSHYGTHLIVHGSGPDGAGLGVYYTASGGDFEDGSGSASMSSGEGASWSAYYWDGDGDTGPAEEDLCRKDDSR